MIIIQKMKGIRRMERIQKIKRIRRMEKSIISGISTLKPGMFIVALALAGVACQSGLDTYSGAPGIYFAMKQTSSAVNQDTVYRESTELPFIITESGDSLLNIKVKILGPVSDKDRHFRVETVSGETDLLPEDCEPVDGEYVLKAGETFGSLPIKFYRAPSLSGKERKLKIRLVENKDFSLPIRLWKNGKDDYVNVNEHTIIISDKYVQLPGYSVGYFGPFSEKKMKLILEIFNLRLTDFNEKLTLTYAKSLGQQFDRYLKEQEAKGEPVLEEDGSKMVAGEYIY